MFDTTKDTDGSLEAYGELRELLCDNQIIYIYGKMGDGRTDTAFLFGEMLKSLEGDTHIHHESGWVKGHDLADARLSTMSGAFFSPQEMFQSGDEHRHVFIVDDVDIDKGIAEWKSLFEHARMLDMKLILVGHRDAPENAGTIDLFVEKESKTEATIYRGSNLKAVLSLTDIPQASTEYCTDELSSFLY